MSKVYACALALALALTVAGAVAQSPADKQFPPEQVTKGAAIYAQHCATCHGNRMVNPPWAIDLATFPRDQRARFVDSVANGVRNMPPWSDVLKPDDIAALWAYLVAGERKD
jgi:mono/diheme cytochrome c family protein